MTVTNGHTDPVALEEAHAVAVAELRRNLALSEEHILEREWSLDLLQEQLASLELAAEDVYYRRIGGATPYEFNRHDLRLAIERSRNTATHNPLISNAVRLSANYVVGQGANVTAKAALVNDVLQAFWDDPANRAELTSPQSLRYRDIDLTVDGNLFFVLFTDATTGRVRVRSIPVDDVADIVCNPEDRREPWYYKREWQQTTLSLDTGTPQTAQQTAYYPDWRYVPKGAPPKTIGAYPVYWDQPVYHVRVGGLGNMRFGVPELFAAFTWATAVTRFHEDGATVRRAQARFAARLDVKGGRAGVAAAKTKLGTTIATGDGLAVETNPPPLTGSTFIGAEGWNYALQKLSGQAPDPDEAHGLLLMVCAGVGLPETMVAGKVAVGNRATATSLDRPTELKMRARQTLWQEVLRDILNYVIDQAAIARKGLLNKGTQVGKDADGRPVVTLAPDDQADPTAPDYDPTAPMTRHFDAQLPSILERAATDRVAAIVSAATLDGKPSAGTLTPKLLAQLLLEALEVAQIDEELDVLFPPEADPNAPDVAAEARLTETLDRLREAVLGLREGRAA